MDNNKPLTIAERREMMHTILDTMLDKYFVWESHYSIQTGTHTGVHTRRDLLTGIIHRSPNNSQIAYIVLMPQFLTQEFQKDMENLAEQLNS